LYNYAGKSHKTQEKVRDVMNRMYAPTPDGYCGDEDNGQTSAWYVFSALGFYPVTPGSAEYVVGSPLFDKVDLQLENGNMFTITADNNSSDNVYIQHATLNNAPYNKTYIKHSDIMKGGYLQFEMSDKPSEWGSGSTSAPYSMSNDKSIKK